MPARVIREKTLVEEDVAKAWVLLEAMLDGKGAEPFEASTIKKILAPIAEGYFHEEVDDLGPKEAALAKRFCLAVTKEDAVRFAGPLRTCLMSRYTMEINRKPARLDDKCRVERYIANFHEVVLCPIRALELDVGPVKPSVLNLLDSEFFSAFLNRHAGDSMKIFCEIVAIWYSQKSERGLRICGAADTYDENNKVSCSQWTFKKELVSEGVAEPFYVRVPIAGGPLSVGHANGTFLKLAAGSMKKSGMLHGKQLNCSKSSTILLEAGEDNDMSERWRISYNNRVKQAYAHFEAWMDGQSVF